MTTVRIMVVASVVMTTPWTEHLTNRKVLLGSGVHWEQCTDLEIPMKFQTLCSNRGWFGKKQKRKKEKWNQLAATCQGTSGCVKGINRPGANRRSPWDIQGSPCRLTWAEHGDTPPPAPGTRMDTGHSRVIESRGLVCRCERRSAVNRGERETAHASPRLPSRFTRTPAGASRTIFLCLPWVLPCPHPSIPHGARMTLKNIIFKCYGVFWKGKLRLIQWGWAWDRGRELRIRKRKKKEGVCFILMTFEISC